MSNTHSKMIEPINPTVARHSSIDDQSTYTTAERRCILSDSLAMITDRYEYEYDQAVDIVGEVNAASKYIASIEQYLKQIVQYEGTCILSEERRIANKQFAECIDRYEYQCNRAVDIDEVFDAMQEYMNDIEQYLKEIGN